jgi:hypothetical protein
MSDVDTLLTLHELATRLREANAPAYEFAAIDDPELVKSVAADMLRFDGASWADVSPNARVHAYGLAECAIASFIQQLIIRSAS